MRPTPACRKFWQIGCLLGDWLFILLLPPTILGWCAFGLHPYDLGCLPAAVALGEASLQEDDGRPVVAALGTRELGFGGHESTLNGGLEHGSAVAFQIALDPLKKRDGLVQAAEVRFDGSHHALLLRARRK